MANEHAVLKIKVIKAVNLSVRDQHHHSSDPYVIVHMGDQTVKTHAINRSLNPEWNHEFNLILQEQIVPIKVEVRDFDFLKKDDLMGHAILDISHLVEAAKYPYYIFPDASIYAKILPNEENGLVSESCITRLQHGLFVQNFHLKLKDVESGELFIEMSCHFKHH